MIIWAIITAIVGITVTIVAFSVGAPVFYTFLDALNTTAYNGTVPAASLNNWDQIQGGLRGGFAPTMILIILGLLAYMYLYAQRKEYVTGGYYG